MRYNAHLGDTYMLIVAAVREMTFGKMMLAIAHLLVAPESKDSGATQFRNQGTVANRGPILDVAHVDPRWKALVQKKIQNANGELGKSRIQADSSDDEHFCPSQGPASPGFNLSVVHLLYETGRGHQAIRYTHTDVYAKKIARYLGGIEDERSVPCVRVVVNNEGGPANKGTTDAAAIGSAFVSV
ncbi:hypothetical protein Plhal703r1_c03g0013971 [Plasmopara halstedii]